MAGLETRAARRSTFMAECRWPQSLGEVAILYTFITEGKSLNAVKGTVDGIIEASCLPEFLWGASKLDSGTVPPRPLVSLAAKPWGSGHLV